MLALMERKTTTAYVSVLEKLKSDCTDFNVQIKSIITDYESALQAAIKIVLPTTETFGCYFHFAKAVCAKYKEM